MLWSVLAVCSERGVPPVNMRNKTSYLPQQAALALCILILFSSHLPPTEGQGRLQLPLGRSSVWRAGVDVPVNFDDHMLECGGYWYKKKHNDQCGLCGDPVGKPRQNEDGGKYANGVITGSYTPGQPAQFKVLLATNRGGYMEFKLCPSGESLFQDCLDRHPIPMADGSGHRYYLPEKGRGLFTVNVTMPSITCEHCVMQWTYIGDNEWSEDETGTPCKGCGAQYQLRNCADISVLPEGSTTHMSGAIDSYNQEQFLQKNLVTPLDPWTDPPLINPNIPLITPSTPTENSIPYVPPQNHKTNVYDPWVRTDSPYPPRENSFQYAWPQNDKNSYDDTGVNDSIPYAPPQNHKNSHDDFWVDDSIPYALPQRQTVDYNSREVGDYLSPSSDDSTFHALMKNQKMNKNDHVASVTNLPSQRSIPYAPPNWRQNWVKSLMNQNVQRVPSKIQSRHRKQDDSDQQQTHSHKSTKQARPKTGRFDSSPNQQNQQKSPFQPLQHISHRNDYPMNPMRISPRHSPDTNVPKINYEAKSQKKEERPSNGYPPQQTEHGMPTSVVKQMKEDNMSESDRPVPQLRCVAIGSKAGMEGMNEWCQENCNEGYCPGTYCSCW